MVSIATIPTELLAHVVDNFQSDIATVRLVCKLFNEIAAPLRAPTGCSYGRNRSICGELLRYPELRPQVRSLKFVRLMSWDFTGYEKALRQDGIRGRVMCQASGQDIALLAKAAEEELPHLATMAIFVISWATDLESLSLTFGSFHFHMDDDILVSHFTKHIAQQFLSKDGGANRHLPLEKLHHLEFHINYNPEHHVQEFSLGDNLKFLVPFLYLPRLKSLKCANVRTECEYTARNNTPEVQLMPYPDRTSSIESVELDGPRFSTLGFGRFLQAFKTLKSLKVTVDSDFPRIIRGPFSDGSLPRVLIEHAPSLEELDLPHNQRPRLTPNAVDVAGPQDVLQFEQYHLRPDERGIEADELPECYKKAHQGEKARHAYDLPRLVRVAQPIHHNTADTQPTP
ncbi:hypothetical protein LB507_005435 [Fusarium sp. FIESC RH6]|nr:hypothetical protein LB507_005435 [Fusarium sp. FIESC RH6]